MTRISLILTTALTLLLASPGHALHCNGTIVTIDAGVGTLYIDDRSDPPGNVWIYLEANGEEGLQSGTPCSFHSCDGPLPIDTRDHCWHPGHDTLLV